MGMYNGIDANGLMGLNQIRMNPMLMQRARAATTPAQAMARPPTSQGQQPQAAQGMMPRNPVQGGYFQMLAEQLARGQSPQMWQNPLMPMGQGQINPWLLGRPG